MRMRVIRKADMLKGGMQMPLGRPGAAPTRGTPWARLVWRHACPSMSLIHTHTDFTRSYAEFSDMHAVGRDQGQAAAVAAGKREAEAFAARLAPKIAWYRYVPPGGRGARALPAGTAAGP